MSKVIERNAEKIIASHEVDELKRMTSFTLADAIRLGSSVSDQATNAWTGEGDTMCALSAGTAAAVALGYLK